MALAFTRTWLHRRSGSFAFILAAFVTAGIVCFPVSTSADIFQWEWIDPEQHGLGKQPSATLAPDGAGVIAEPGAVLSGLNLTKAYLIGADLSNSFASTARFIDADLTDANLTGARWQNADFTNAVLVGATIESMRLTSSTVRGFTSAQLYSTQSYLDRNLSRVLFDSCELIGWNFTGQTLTEASFFISNLTNANFSHADLTNSTFRGATVTGVNLSGAIVRGANFGGGNPSRFYTGNARFDSELRKPRFTRNSIAKSRSAWCESRQPKSHQRKVQFSQPDKCEP